MKFAENCLKNNPEKFTQHITSNSLCSMLTYLTQWKYRLLCIDQWKVYPKRRKKRKILKRWLEMHLLSIFYWLFQFILAKTWGSWICLKDKTTREWREVKIICSRAGIHAKALFFFKVPGQCTKYFLENAGDFGAVFVGKKEKLKTQVWEEVKPMLYTIDRKEEEEYSL